MDSLTFDEVRMLRKIIAFGSLVLLTACTASSPEPEQVVLSNGTKITKTTVGELPVQKMRWLHIGGQPSQEDLRVAKEQGFEAIVNLRLPGEKDWDERQAVTDLGMEYRQVAFINSDTKEFYKAGFNEMNDVYKNLYGKKVLVHCSSGNRAAAWLTSYLATQNNQNIADALVVGEGMGLSKDALKDKVVEFVNQTALSED